jgi:dCTP deaminase
MAFWSGQRLSTDGSTRKIVEPFDPDRIDCSAYTLTLGAEAYVTPNYGDSPRDSVKLDLAEPVTVNIGGKLQNRGGGKVVIPPGQFAFLLTEETVKIPSESMGFISLKSKPKFGGLINVSGFHVDPGFTGKLIFSVFNAGPNVLHFARGDLLFLLWIADLSFTDVSEKAREDFRKQDIGYAEIPSDLVTKVAAENHSLQSLSRRVETLTSRVTIIGAVAAGLGVVFGLLASWMAFAPDKVVGYKVQIERNVEPAPTSSALSEQPSASPTP